MKRILNILVAFVMLTDVVSAHKFYCEEEDGCNGEGVRCDIQVYKKDGTEIVQVTMLNLRPTPFQPLRAGVKLDIDTYMDKYPEWNDKYFPTLLMCEPDHFYGYVMSPSGKMKSVVSPDPVASWSLDYNLGYQDPAPHWFMGHRVEAINIDLLAALPLPENHPQNLWQLAPGEKKEWKIIIRDLENIDDFERMVAQDSSAPAIRMMKTSFAPNEPISFVIYGNSPEARLDGRLMKLEAIGEGIWLARSKGLPSGIFKIMVSDNGRLTHGYVNVRFPWWQTIGLAREASLRYKQKATSHVESWYGFHSAFIAARHFPSKSLDRQLDTRFDMVFGNLFDSTGMPYKYEWRIQNTSSTIGILVDRFEAYGNIRDLEAAEKLADRMISYSQKDDGAFMNGHTVYSSVIYPAKSLLELYDAEMAAGRGDKASSYFDSARRAVDQLVASNGNFNTEGEITYEDGMVSCSALQMGCMALHCDDATQKRRYVKAMLEILDGHDCLTQLRVCDGRRRGGTMRFWEAQYDVHMLPNMISSPHGWSAWRGYASYYAYLLTGEERYLIDTFDLASSLASLIDHKSGKLRWAFVVDPDIRVTQICVPDPASDADKPSYGTPHPDLYPNKSFKIGSQYIDMISDWQTMVSSDNDVHEAFKFIGEAVLTNAFVIERADGTFGCYNCKISKKGKKITVKADEAQIKNLHLNLKNDYKIEFDGKVEYFSEG